MTMSAMPGGEIVRAENLLPYLRVGSHAIAALEASETDPDNELYLAGDIVVGEYGVAAFNVVVPHPEERPSYFSVDEGPCGPYHIRDFEGTPIGENPMRLAHFLNTEQGFAAVRTVIAPTSVEDFLRGDRHLGPALVKKASLDGVMPGGFDEEERLPVWHALGYRTHEQRYEPFVERVKQAAGFEDYARLCAYTSWHPYRAYNSVDAALREASTRTVRNFDQMLAILTGLPKALDFTVDRVEGVPAVEA